MNHYKKEHISERFHLPVSQQIMYVTHLRFLYCFIYNPKVLNENLNTGILMLLQDCYCYNYDTKKASGSKGT